MVTEFENLLVVRNATQLGACLSDIGEFSCNIANGVWYGRVRVTVDRKTSCDIKQSMRQFAGPFRDVSHAIYGGLDADRPHAARAGWD